MAVKKTGKKYPIRYQRKVVGYLNESMIERKGLSPETIKVLQKLHGERHKLYEMMKATDDPTELKRLFALVTDVEFKMQHHWGFPLSQRHHYWFKVPKCTCPFLDSFDVWGTQHAFMYMQSDCPVHENFVESTPPIL